MDSCDDTLAGGLPHSDIHGSMPARGSPWLFAACHVLHRLLVPRHPPNALLILDTPDPDPTVQIHHAQKPSSETGISHPMPGVRNTRHGDQVLPTMILRYRHFAHHRIVSNR